MPKPRPTSTSTRDALLAQALRLFGQRGYDGTTTRAIADAAGTNVASIAYHFGGKAGLHAACVEEVGRRIDRIARLPVSPARLGSEEAAATLESLLGTAVTFLFTADAAGEIVPFILRIVTEADEGADHLYTRLFQPRHRELCALWARATGTEAESEATRLTVFALLGQLVYFRINRAFVMQRMGWASAGPAEARAVTRILTQNLRAALERSKAR